MADLNDIFGYKVYKPPPEKEAPYIHDLDFNGEIVSLIDANADVIQDPAVQQIFKSLEGDRVVKIEDLPPDVRYDGWNRKAHYNEKVIDRNPNPVSKNILPKQPILNHNILRPNENTKKLHDDDALRQAQLVARQNALKEQELGRQLQETKLAVEREIHRQLVEQLSIRAQKKSVTPEQQALIEKLYLDLKSINPELAFATLQASTTSFVEPAPTTKRVVPQHQHQQQHQQQQQVQIPRQVAPTSAGSAGTSASSVPRRAAPAGRGQPAKKAPAPNTVKK